jgi:hypothetical protein
MSRKPVDQQQPSECRQAIWDWIRGNSTTEFTARDIDVRLEISTIGDYLTGLKNAGHLEVVTAGGKGLPTVYKAVNLGGHIAPRVRKDGTPVTQGKSRLFMWRVMQILKTFTSLDLAYNASTPEHAVSEVDAKDFIGHLFRAGYLVHAKTVKPGQKQVYRLKAGMWTGPQPPQVQRTRQIYDPNLQRVVWAAVTGGAE